MWHSDSCHCACYKHSFCHGKLAEPLGGSHKHSRHYQLAHGPGTTWGSVPHPPQSISCAHMSCFACPALSQSIKVFPFYDFFFAWMKTKIPVFWTQWCFSWEFCVLASPKKSAVLQISHFIIKLSVCSTGCSWTLDGSLEFSSVIFPGDTRWMVLLVY